MKMCFRKMQEIIAYPQIVFNETLLKEWMNYVNVFLLLKADFILFSKKFQFFKCNLYDL